MKTTPIVFGIVSATIVGISLGQDSWSQSYPSKPVRLIMGGSAGGGAETVLRPIAQKLSEGFGQQVIVESRAGGGGAVSALAARAAPADGYTMYQASASSMSIVPAVRRNPPYDPAGDFSPVTLVATAPLMVAVHPSLPVKSIGELVALAKAGPRQLLAASNGEGTIQHLTIEMLSRAAGIVLLHVPYKGGTPAVIDTAGGQTQMIITALPTLLAQVRASRLRAIAVTGGHRTPIVPNVPTVAESGWAGFESVQWYGIFAPRNAPAAAIDRWFAEMRKVAEDSSVRSVLAQEGAEPAVNGPVRLAEFHRVDMAKWRKVARESNIVVE